MATARPDTLNIPPHLPLYFERLEILNRINLQIVTSLIETYLANNIVQYIFQKPCLFQYNHQAHQAVVVNN